MLRQTTAMKKIQGLLVGFPQVNTFIFQGGQGAGKTISILLVLLNQAYSIPASEITIAGEELSKMRKTVIRDLEKMAKAVNYWGVVAQWNKSDLTLRFNNGSYIEFVGADKADIGKGMRRDFIYFNEANRLDYAFYGELAGRAKKILIDFNPNAEFWVHSEIMGAGTEQEEHWYRTDLVIDGRMFEVKAHPALNADRRIEVEGETVTPNIWLFTILTFKDNEALSIQERQTILNYKIRADQGSTIDRNKWQVYGLGLPGIIAGVIFPDVKYIKDIPDHATFIGYGVDFGFGDSETNDPTAVGEVWRGMEGDRKCLYIRELLYKRGVGIDALHQFLQNRCTNRDGFICGDGGGGGALFIKELQVRGNRIIPAIKGQGSINAGLEIMGDYQIYIVGDSPNAKNEFRLYKRDEVTGLPADRQQDHFIDAARYVVHTSHSRRNPIPLSQSAI